MQLAILEVVTQSSSSTGLPQYVSLIWGLATCTLPSPLAWRMFICGKRSGSCLYFTLFRLGRTYTSSPGSRCFVSFYYRAVLWILWWINHQIYLASFASGRRGYFGGL